MYDKIKSNLNNIKDLQERAVFKQVLTNVFLNLYNYTQRSIYSLEDRVYNELIVNDAYNIYGTVSRRSEVDLSSSFFFPMMPEKMDVPVYNFDSIKAVLAKNNTMKLFEVFF